ncbi:MAG: Ig-like domain-containing protein [Gemmatimonadales bacterium]
MALALLVAGPTCSYPTDDSDGVAVVISGAAYVLRGDQDTLVARALRAAGADTADLTNVMYSWTSTDPTVATVRDLGRGVAEVAGVDTGAVDITARPVAFEAADARPFTLRVSNPLTVDSVRPDTVRWGDIVTVFGIGVDSLIIQARLEPAILIQVPLSGRRDTVTGLAQVSYWVPYPARTDSVFFLGPGLFGWEHETTIVMLRDLYEPNDAAPRRMSLDTLTGPFPTIPAIRLFNPALAFEPLGALAGASDWYRFSLFDFTPGPARDITVIVNAPLAKSSFLADSVEYDIIKRTPKIGPYAWKIGRGDHACLGLPFTPRQRASDSSIVAFGAGTGTRPFGFGPRLHQVFTYDRVSTYAMAVVEGYVLTDPAFPRDAHEEDDYCDAGEPTADPLVPVPFRDTMLTIDNPADIDWFRVRGTGQVVRFRMAVFGGPSLVVPDTTRDIDLYLMRVPVLTETQLPVQAVDSTTRPNADFSVFLPAGIDHYVVVVDAAGVPTRYGLCFGLAGSCDTFPASVSARSVTSSRDSRRALGGPILERRRLPPVRP